MVITVCSVFSCLACAQTYLVKREGVGLKVNTITGHSPPSLLTLSPINLACLTTPQEARPSGEMKGNVVFVSAFLSLPWALRTTNSNVLGDVIKRDLPWWSVMSQ